VLEEKKIYIYTYIYMREIDLNCINVLKERNPPRTLRVRIKSLLS